MAYYDAAEPIRSHTLNSQDQVQFIKGGPYIPERLLDEHEKGNVVFFCGAGISLKAGLPDFPGLTQQLIDEFADAHDPEPQKAKDAGELDEAINILEDKVIGGRQTVRRRLASILLNANLDNSGAIDSHKALLALGRTSEGYMRLVTTNFDRLFEEAISLGETTVDESSSIKRHQGQLFSVPNEHLPVPNSHLDGLIYLHGLLMAEPTEKNLDGLVVSKGDFGSAYVTDSWAADFMIELFRNFTVCFVGYSMNDPLMSVIVRTLSNDGSLNRPFVFDGHSKNQKEEIEKKWEAKPVTPILYWNYNRHFYLHRTIQAWSRAYKDKVHGKKELIRQFARRDPSKNSSKDDFVERVLWAIRDPSGLPAKYFAEINRAPPLNWLFLTSLENIINKGVQQSEWDEMTQQLMPWLLRHLNDPKLLLWLSERGDQLSTRFKNLIKERLAQLSELECSNKATELTRIRKNSPNGIPSSRMKKLWHLLLSGYIKPKRQNFAMDRWCRQFNGKGFTSELQKELWKNLTPYASLQEPSCRIYEVEDEHKHMRYWVDWEIRLSASDVHESIRKLSGNDQWKNLLPQLFPQFNSLLLDTFTLMNQLEDADDRNDLSYFQQPSISKHPQNTNFYEWTALIEFTRDAWLALKEKSTEQAVEDAMNWWNTPYPLFRRLAFFAAAQDKVIPNHIALDWLLGDENWWLWASDTKREVMCLLTTLAPKIQRDMPEGLTRLEEAILTGPPREMYKKGIEPEQWDLIVDGSTWLRLAKIVDANVVLDDKAKERWDFLCAKYPEWKLSEDKRDEFSVWMSEGPEILEFINIPRESMELINWLRQNPDTKPRQQDDWQQYCRDEFDAASHILCILAEENYWPHRRWQKALQAWSEEEFLEKSWRKLAPVLVKVPEKELRAISQELSQWLRGVAQVFNDDKKFFFKLVNRILNLDRWTDIDSDQIIEFELEDDMGIRENPVMSAMNHPVGYMTDTLICWWFRKRPKEGQKLPRELKSIFTELCNVQNDKYQHARVVLAQYVTALFCIDPKWSDSYLLPLFDWGRCSDVARSAWMGFLSNAHVDPLLMQVLKHNVLETANHYCKLDEYSCKYADFITIAALHSDSVFSNDELKRVIGILPSEGLQKSVHTLIKELGKAVDKIAYWTDHIAPYLQYIFPYYKGKITQEVSRGLAHLCLIEEKLFPKAFDLICTRLQNLEDISYLPDILLESKLFKEHPKQTLDFLYRLVGEGTDGYSVRKVATCLEEIQKVAPELKDDPQFVKLDNFSRQHGASSS